MQDFVVKNGFTPGSEEYHSAINRVSDRIAEWNRYSDTYKAWSKRKRIDVSFNREGTR